MIRRKCGVLGQALSAFKRGRCMKKLIGLIVILLWSLVAVAEVTITNLTVAQRPGTKLVDITYDIFSATTNRVWISLTVSNGSSAVIATNLIGDVGTDVAVGTSKSIVWDMSVDWNGKLTPGIVFNLTRAFPVGGDPSADGWEVVNAQWVKNIYTNGNVTMRDRNTGKMWVYRVTNPYGLLNWNGAKNYSDNLVYAGYSDWQLPDIDTLTAQYSQRSFFTNVQNEGYWSGTSGSGSLSYCAWCVNGGGVFIADKSTSSYYVWSVRSGSFAGRAAGATATANLDSRDYKLTVVSAHGTPVPNIGTNVYAWRATVTCAVASVVDQGINWRATGWSGTGSVPATGTTNSTGEILLTNVNSSITWSWGTSFSITNVIAAQRPGTKLVDISYDIISEVTNAVPISFKIVNGAVNVPVSSCTGDVGVNVLPGTGKHIVWNMGADWNLNSTLLAYSVMHTTVTNLFGAVVAPSDSRNYTLTVISAHDTPVPNIGTNLYAWSSAVTCSVPTPVIEQGVRWRNTGWSGTDSVPATGTTNSTGEILLTNVTSSITWNWETDFVITNVIAEQRPGTKLIDITYDIISELTEATAISLQIKNGITLVPIIHSTGDLGTNVLPNIEHQIVWDMGADWNTNSAMLTYSVLHATATDISSSTEAQSDSRNYALVVSSAHGTPVPSIGTNLYAWRTTVIGKVDNAVISGLTNWTSAGWSGAGSVPVSGVSTNTGGIVLTGLVSAITWNWNTNYWLEVIKSGSGSVNPSSGWRLAGENLSLAVTPSNGWLFMSWSGDASGDYTATNIIIPIVRPVSLTATFSDDADGDGLLNTNETALGTNPRKKDTDGDGLSDPQELIAGTSPTNSASVLAVKLSTDVSANQVSWYGVSGRYYRLEYTDDLANGWTPKGTVSSGANAQIMKLDITSGGKRFYRIRVSDSPSGL